MSDHYHKYEYTMYINFISVEILLATHNTPLQDCSFDSWLGKNAIISVHRMKHVSYTNFIYLLL